MRIGSNLKTAERASEDNRNASTAFEKSVLLAKAVRSGKQTAMTRQRSDSIKTTNNGSPNQDYDATLNDLASRMAAGVNIDNRTVTTISGDAATDFSKLVQAKLASGKVSNLQDAVDAVKKDLFARLKTALGNIGKNADKGLNVFEGYWKRHGGESDAVNAAYTGYNNYLANQLDTSSGDYHNDLDALAQALANSADSDTRTIDHLTSSPKLEALYKNLIRQKYQAGLSQADATQAVNKDLHDRIHGLDSSAANVFDGYWKRHGGSDDANQLAGAVYQSKLSGDASQGENDTLNSLATEIANGLNLQGRKTLYLKGDLAKQFQTLVSDQLNEQKARGLNPDLDGAIKHVKSELDARLHNALTNSGKSGKDADLGVNIFDGYWDRHGGASDAATAGYAAYAQFLADNTDTNNTNYQDNLNALAVAIGGSVIPGQRMIDHLNSNPTLSKLYKNLIQSKLKAGENPHKAETEVNKDLRGRLGDAAPASVKDDVLNIFDGYWTRHGGQADASNLTTDAYKAYIGVDETDDQWSAIDDSQYSNLDALKKWDDLTSGMGDKSRFESEQRLNRPLAAAELLEAHWKDWGMDKGRSFSDTSGLSEQGKEVLNYINKNPALETALDVANGHSGKANGVIQKDDVEAFVKQMKSDVGKAASSFDKYKKANPNASATALEMTRSAALLAANQQITENADPADRASAKNTHVIDDLVTPAGLASLAKDNPDLASGLTGAAKLWSKAGMFQQLDKAGDDYATNGFDQRYSGDNIRSWIEKQAPTTDAETTSLLQRAAQIDLTANVDVSNLGPDVFKHPGKYSGKQKAAVLEHLLELKTQIQVGNKEDLWDSYNLPSHGDSDTVNPNVKKVLADIQGKINQLQSDPDVGKFYKHHYAGAMQALGSSDSQVHDALENFYNDKLKSGDALNDAFNSKNTSGKKRNPAEALSVFVNETKAAGEALGKKSDDNSNTRLVQEAVKNSGRMSQLKTYYENEIVSGKELKDAINSGEDMSTAVNDFTSDAANFGAALPGDYVKSHLAELQKNYSDTISSLLLGNADSSSISSIFGDGNGNLDESKLRDAISAAEKQDPQAFTDSNGVTVAPDAIVKMFRNVFDLVRNGYKVKDAIGKYWKAVADGHGIPIGDAPKGTTPKAYGMGAMHAVSALLAGGILAAKSAEHHGNGKATANSIGAGAVVLGNTMEAGSKYSKTQKLDPSPLPKSTFSTIESAGKIVGGAGNAITGGLAIFSGVQDLKNNDGAAAGFDLTNGITSSFAAVAGLVDGGASLASALGVDVADTVVAAIGTISGTISIIAGGVAAIAVLGYLIYEAVEESKHVNAFNGQIGPQLAQWGITGGPIEKSDIPADMQKYYT